MLTDPHLGVVRLWLLLHICTVLFKCVVICIWEPQQLQRKNWTRKATAVSIAQTSGRRPKTLHPNSTAEHRQCIPELNSPTAAFTNIVEDTSSLCGLSMSLATSEKLSLKCQSTDRPTNHTCTRCSWSAGESHHEQC